MYPFKNRQDVAYRRIVSFKFIGDFQELTTKEKTDESSQPKADELPDHKIEKSEISDQIVQDENI